MGRGTRSTISSNIQEWCDAKPSLPECVLAKVLSYSSFRGRIVSRGVNRTWRAATDDHSAWNNVDVPDKALSSSADPTLFVAGLSLLAERCLSKTLSMAMPEGLPHTALQSVLSHCQALLSLEIRVCPEATHQSDYLLGVISQASLPMLTHVKHPLPPSYLDSDERYHRSSLRALVRKCPNLTSLDFSLPTPGDVTAHRLVDALHHAPMLTRLNVANCSNVDDRILIPLSRCKHLAYVNLYGTSVSFEGAKWLVSQNPAVEVRGLDRRVSKDPEGAQVQESVGRDLDGVEDSSLLCNN